MLLRTGTGHQWHHELDLRQGERVISKREPLRSSPSSELVSMLYGSSGAGAWSWGMELGHGAGAWSRPRRI
jgi:hypothetical protein